MGLHLEQLEEMLFNKAIPRSRFVLGLSTALQVLCKKYNIAVEGTGKKGQWVKVDCLKAIDIFREHYFSATMDVDEQMPTSPNVDRPTPEESSGSHPTADSIPVVVMDEPPSTHHAPSQLPKSLSHIATHKNPRDVCKVSKLAIKVQLHPSPQSWRVTQEVMIEWLRGEDIHLDDISKALAISESCQVLDPKNRYPFYQYKPNYLEGDDVEYLLDEGSLHVVPVSYHK